MAGKILGKLKGIIASASENSRNGRKYTENFWDTFFDSDIFKEGMENKMYFGELYHPDEEEKYGQIHPGDEAAILLDKVEKQGKDYIGTFSILPTRAGEVLKNLVDIGCTFGVSSRGYNDYDSSYFDDPSAFELITWDIVAFPGIKSARLHPISAVAENFNINKKQKRIKAMENLNKISSEDKYAKKYIDSVLKTKEDFDTDLQVEDIMAGLDGGFPESYEDNDFIIFDKDNKPYYDDGKHGKAEVITNKINQNIIDTSKPGDAYIADNVFWLEKLKKYGAYGNWLKIN